jgi:hypothetical protein
MYAIQSDGSRMHLQHQMWPTARLAHDQVQTRLPTNRLFHLDKLYDWRQGT